MTGLLGASTIKEVRAAKNLAPFPRVQAVRPDSASIVWNDRAPAEVFVEWSDGDDGEWHRAGVSIATCPPDLAGAEDFRFRCHAVLDGLPPDTMIRYRIRAAQEFVEHPAFCFKTLSRSRTHFRAVAFGDSGSDGEPLRRLALRMFEDRPGLVLHTGDTAYPVADFPSLTENYLRPLAGLMSSAPLYPCLGNHDTAATGGAPLLWLHDLPAGEELPPKLRRRNYRFRAGFAEFFAVDTNESLMDWTDELLAWLDEALEESRAFWRVVFFHHTPYPGARHSGDVHCAAVRERLVPLIERHSVPLVLCGHQHSYARTAPPAAGETRTLWVTTGGGGGGLYDDPPAGPNVTGCVAHHYVRLDFKGYRLTLSAIGLDGETLDQLVLQPPPAIESIAFHCDGSMRLRGRHLALTAGEAPVDFHVLHNGDRAEVTVASPTEIQLRSPVPASVLRIVTPNGSAGWDSLLPPL